MSVLKNKQEIQLLDLFCGIGGFRIAAEIACQEKNIKPKFVFSSDIDSDAQKIYHANFEEIPQGDITKIDAANIPEHDILLAGFPCQPFSICGDLKGFKDSRGTLFFDIARILEAKQPSAFILENVKQLKGHQQGKTLQRIIETLKDLGYYTDYQVLNALDFGLPQKRERIFIVGLRNHNSFVWRKPKIIMKPLSYIIEKSVNKSYYASERIRQNRLAKTRDKIHNTEPTIWHENKSGNISIYPFSCALRSGASYNYLLVNGERRLTEREMLRLQGFPDSYKIIGSYQAMRKLVGNTVAIPCVVAVFESVLDVLLNSQSNLDSQSSIITTQLSLFNHEGLINHV
ncbi:DNA (cytosine-5-)-methyltransferase [Aphanothece hegewaldii CCALA 016]|uniref:Cytosine-specific methyltransferase n=1 Tax=Aphanothece hegewaldii CCALA 016 TaxID=2107694 RepID=A0A2T1M218_9CHRO|nr:DNA (cytosine-5-)-methyltransferase [Aphanothece hegewaldii]PSF38753.1 DNA (cytosine-5-)-methyltransferase [Aphanothece hegewaldii CCALA 016]